LNPLQEKTMAVSGVSLTSPASQIDQADPRQLLFQLANAIKAGNITGAQQAFAQLTQALGNTTANDANSKFGQALDAIGQALQGNDINGAQQALAQLQQQAQPGRRHHHHGGGQPNETNALSANSPPPPGTGNNVDVTV
jgi:hypothetical protein